MNRSVLNKLIIGLLIVSVVRSQPYGCKLTNTTCSNNGQCQSNGLCICNSGYSGENCENKMGNSFVNQSLGKGFIAGWVIFWIAINFLAPWLIWMMIRYLKEKNCNDIKEHLKDCFTSVACCFGNCCRSNNSNFRSSSQNNHPEAVRINENPPSGAINIESSFQRPPAPAAGGQPLVALNPGANLVPRLPPINNSAGNLKLANDSARSINHSPSPTPAGGRFGSGISSADLIKWQKDGLTKHSLQVKTENSKSITNDLGAPGTHHTGDNRKSLELIITAKHKAPSVPNPLLADDLLAALPPKPAQQ